MDESFAFFLKRFGLPIARRDVAPTYATTYTGRLPAQLLQYWIEHGFAGYANGLLWTVDPSDYETLLEACLAGLPFEGQDHYHVVARTAFGNLFVWGKKSGASLQIDVPHSILFPDRAAGKFVQQGREDFALQMFFESLEQSRADFADDAGQPLFARALKKLGPIAPDEMYGFEPALSLGGKAALAALCKVKILPHLEILAQIEPLRIVENPLFRP
jgi:hypothetical protein